ncbi:MAG TPA: type IIL restriction-modification enzyme MmeI [Pseudolabrys sp.]
MYEAALDTDQPDIEFQDKFGRINADLTVGIDVTSAAPLHANERLCSPGVKLHGDGFIVTREGAEHLGLGKRPGLEKHIREYRNGRDLTARPRGVMVIDLFGLESEQVRQKFPEVYQHVKGQVKERIEIDDEGKKKFIGRDWNSRETYKINWWIFGEPRSELRPALDGLRRYIATVETAKHRVFQFLSAEILPDNMLVCIADEEAFILGVLSSRIHMTWTLMQGGTLEDRPRYTKSACFDPFPFPSPGDLLKSQIRAVAEELDAFRKERQKEHPSLTLTQMYNVLEKLRAIEAQQASSPPGLSRGSTTSGDAARKDVDGRDKHGHDETKVTLTDDEERIKKEGLILILKEHHDKLDRLVFEGYGWPQTLTDEQILEKLVALNHERAAEEKRGHVRWLRPDYQIPRFGKDLDKMAAKEEGAQIAAELGLGEPSARKLSFPTDAVSQTAAVFAALAAASAPVAVSDIASAFRKSKNLEKNIGEVLASLARLGHVATKDGKSFEIRRVA